MTETGKPERLTAAHRRQFHAALLKWRDRLGLIGWRVVLSNKPCSACANVETFYEDKLARVQLGREWGSLPVNDQTIDELALHEMMHVLMYAIHEAYKAPPSKRDSAVLAAEHGVINSMVRLSIAPEYGGFQ